MEKYVKKTGIMGGTFNPIHIGHLLLAESAKDAYALDEILFIPSGLPYMKNPDSIADKRMRLEMTRLAIEDNPAFKLSSVEVEREGNSYTVETLLTLKEQEPDTEFYFIMGADSLFNIESWKEPAGIFRSCVLLAAVRNGNHTGDMERQIQYLIRRYGARIHLLPIKEITISSTDIRKSREQNRSIRYMVPDKVVAYIEEHGLYRRKQSKKTEG